MRQVHRLVHVTALLIVCITPVLADAQTTPAPHAMQGDRAYMTRLQDAIRANVDVDESRLSSLNIAAEVEILTSRRGSVTHVQLLRSSGDPNLDAAVIQAAKRTRLPKDAHGKVPARIHATFRPQ